MSSNLIPNIGIWNKSPSQQKNMVNWQAALDITFLWTQIRRRRLWMEAVLPSILIAEDSVVLVRGDPGDGKWEIV